MVIHQETYKRASQDKRRLSVATKCAQKFDQLQSEIDSLKLTETTPASKLTAFELRKQSLIPHPTSQEAVEAIGVVLNPPPLENHAQNYNCTIQGCERFFSTEFGLGVHLRWHNKNNK